MGSIQNPVGEGPNDPYEGYRVEPSYERRSKESYPGPPDDKPPKNKLGFGAYILRLFQKAVNFFVKEHQSTAEAQTSVREHLLFLKKSFEILKKEDRSQDVIFLNSLSVAWVQALDDSVHLSNPKVDLKFRELVKKISQYPENEQHTLGYYLTEYAGQKWVPFPYMELIQKIHHEHELDPDTSVLSEWVHLLNEITSLLNN